MNEDDGRVIAVKWLEELTDKVGRGIISKAQADNEVFEEMASGDHHAEVEQLYSDFTMYERKDT